MKLKQTILTIICCASIPAVYAAGSITLTESLADSLKASKFDGETTYHVETAGKFSVTAKIPGDAFNTAEVYWEDLNEDTEIEISMGDFIFSSSLSGADKHKLTASTLTANWSAAEDVCDANDKCKSIKSALISLNAAKNSNIATLKVSGTNKSGTEFADYGSAVFASLCSDNGNGELPDATATLSINGKPIPADLTVKCKVNNKTVTKVGEPYDLRTVTVTGKMKM